MKDVFDFIDDLHVATLDALELKSRIIAMIQVEMDKIIDEFAETLLQNAPRTYADNLELNGRVCYLSANDVKETAKQTKVIEGTDWERKKSHILNGGNLN